MPSSAPARPCVQEYDPIVAEVQRKLAQGKGEEAAWLYMLLCCPSQPSGLLPPEDGGGGGGGRHGFGWAEEEKAQCVFSTFVQVRTGRRGACPAHMCREYCCAGFSIRVQVQAAGICIWDLSIVHVSRCGRRVQCVFSTCVQLVGYCAGFSALCAGVAGMSLCAGA